MKLCSVFLLSIFFSIPLGLTAAPQNAHAAELVMFHADHCMWCLRWDEEIGVAYPLTQEAKKAPLRKVDYNEDTPEDLNAIQPVVFTPTFVLVENGQEIGRITGYPGEENFWGLLNQMLDQVDNSVSLSP